MPSPLTPGVFRADDGGALYVAVDGSAVFAFAEHPGRDYAFVLHGTLSSDRIDGRWWDIPKHRRATRGRVELQVSQGGDRLVRKSSDADIGVHTFTRLDGTIPWPQINRPAGFQSTRNADLDGKFGAPTGQRIYLREIGSDVIGVSEVPRDDSERPDRVSVLIGSRQSNGGVKGRFADVPKGRRTAEGTMAIAQVSGSRRISLHLTGADLPGTIFEPLYNVDFRAVESSMHAALANRVIGYGFAFSHGERVVAEGVGGWRRLGQDDRSGNNARLPFTSDTQVETASSAKLVTAAILIRALVEKGIGLDARAVGALPRCWSKGTGITGTRWGLTWRNLLGHTSRLIRPAACNDNPYECLRQSVATGRTGPPGRDYQNINYTILRYMIPAVRDKERVEEIFDRHGCSSSNGSKINAEVSELFRRYVSDEVLAPLGIVGTFEPVDEFAIRYDFSRPGAQGIRPAYDDILRAGSGGMKFSAREFVKFMAALETGKIVPVDYVRVMRHDLLGYDATIDGAAGDYPWKNGGAGGVSSWAMSFPSGVNGYVVVNSDNNNLSKSLGSILSDAFDDAIV